MNSVLREALRQTTFQSDFPSQFYDAAGNGSAT